MPRSATHTPETIDEAWHSLAADVLLLAIEDVRQTRDPKKRTDTKRWLLSKDAKLFLDFLNIEIDISAWIEADCPELENE